MKTVIIKEPNHDGNFKYTRETCRAAIVRRNQILMSHETAIDQWLFPGGGVEDGETYEECCAREVREETGFMVNVGDMFATVVEYYGDTRHTHRYYICTIQSACELKLTDREIVDGARPEWIDIDKLKSILEKSTHTTDDNDDNHRIHLREYNALSAYLDHVGK